MTGHVNSNRESWDRRSAEYAAYGRRSWARRWPSEEIWRLRKN